MIRRIISQLTYNPSATLQVLFTFLFFIFTILMILTETSLWYLFAALGAISGALGAYFYLKEY